MLQNWLLNLPMLDMDEKIRNEQPNYPNVNVAGYFAQNISFELDKEKRVGMKNFLNLPENLNWLNYNGKDT